MSQMWAGLERSRETITRVEARFVPVIGIVIVIIIVIVIVTITITTTTITIIIIIRLEELWQRVDALRPTIDTKLERLMEVGASSSSSYDIIVIVILKLASC